MKRLSYWARLHPWTSRIIIVISHILILWFGWYTGSVLSKMNIILPAVLLFTFILIYLLSVILYPSNIEKRKLGAQLYYYRQKICDLTLTLSAWAMIVCIANNPTLHTGFFNNVAASSVATGIATIEKPTAAEILESLKHRDKSTLTRTEKRILKKEFYVQLKKYAVAKVKRDQKASDDTGLIILAIVGALGLAYLVGALACSLSCNGNDGAAVIVALLGMAGIIIGLIFVIKAIKKRHSKIGNGS